MTKYFFLNPNDTVAGPLTAAGMMEMFRSCMIHAGTSAALGGDSSWRPFSELLPLLRYELTPRVSGQTSPGKTAQIEAACRCGRPLAPALAQLLEDETHSPVPGKLLSRTIRSGAGSPFSPAAPRVTCAC